MDISSLRDLFPALRRTLNGRPAAYLDGPGGTQVPESVIEAMVGFMRSGGSNHGGVFMTSRETDAVTASARSAVADLFGASADEIVFGQNMTSLTLSVSRALGATWSADDNVVVTRLDHDANVWPWVMAARDAGAEVRWFDFDPDDGCRLNIESIGNLVDVAALGTDFLVASAYKFFGPHTGALYGRRDVLNSVDAYKIRPAPDDPPDKWETGTQSFESLAGVAAAVDYISSLGTGETRRDQLRSAMEQIGVYERSLSERFLSGIANMPGITLYGQSVPDGRTPTFAVSVDGTHPDTVAKALGDQGIFVWSGDYYPVEVMRRLGGTDQGGLVRIGFAHYNTAEEVERVLAALGDLAPTTR
jgi:selenocysteine lyase/cysteine desulfurase